MIQKAIEYIVSLSKASVQEINGGNYHVGMSGVNKIKLSEPKVQEVSTLSAIVEYIKRGVDDQSKERLIIHVESPLEVTLKSELYGPFEQRDRLIRATPMTPKIEFGRWLAAEEFNIQIQSKFQDTEDKQTILKVVGNIKEESVKGVGDDGVSQTVTAKVGVATVGHVKVPNPVVLKPFRTFIEIDQPESQFIFRMQTGPQCALFEADGCAWRVEAMQRIAKYFEEQFADYEGKERIIVLS